VGRAGAAGQGLSCEATAASRASRIQIFGVDRSGCTLGSGFTKTAVLCAWVDGGGGSAAAVDRKQRPTHSTHDTQRVTQARVRIRTTGLGSSRRQVQVGWLIKTDGLCSSKRRVGAWEEIGSTKWWVGRTRAYVQPALVGGPERSQTHQKQIKTGLRRLCAHCTHSAQGKTRGAMM